MDLFELLGAMVVNQASDLFISVDSPPLLKIEGKFKPAKPEALSSEENHQLIYSILGEREVAEYKRHRELNTSLNLERLGRFRVNVFQQCGEPAMVIRYIKKVIPTLEELGLPMVLSELIMRERGLILLVGATGTGKSTTLASMIDYRNRNQSGHILTIEDPIEYLHKNHLSLVNQREVGVDTDSFEIALKNAMREAPDVILIGEIRDRQTMKQALTYAETGHLCLATLHANNANQAMERIVNFFPEDAHKIILQDIATNLNAVIAQRLCIGEHESRVAAVEIMINTPFIQKLIETDRLDEIKEAMSRSKGRINQTFDDALYELVSAGKISKKEALRKADSANNLRVRFKLGKEKHLGNTEIDDELNSEFIIQENAPFDQYNTFCITPLTVRAKHPETKRKINNALLDLFRGRGLKYSPNNPDVEVQYVLGLKVEEGLELEAIEGQQNNFKHFILDTKETAMLMINVLDNKKQKAIYRTTAVRNVTDFNESQEQLSASIKNLLKNLPVGNKSASKIF